MDFRNKQAAEILRSQKLEEFWNQINYVSPSLGLNFFTSPLLKYNYPQANVKIINNIAHALMWNPRFYTQVLHLMNKMNLPPPFDQDNSIEIVNLTMTKYQSTKRRNDSEEETEESDEEVYQQENRVNYVPNLVPRRRKVKRLKVGFVGDKIIERNIKKGSEKKEISREKIFEKANLIVDKPNILIHIKHDDNQTKETQRKEAQGKGSQANDAQENFPQESASQGFGVIQPQDKLEAEEPVKEFFDFKNLITESELRLNRLSPSQWNGPGYSKLFKNYEPGHLNCRLYIKNIAKQAQPDDLKRIFGRWINLDSETERNMFDVQLLKQGKMKGQAFITMPNEVIAEEALKQTNGYLLYGKPIVVVFARSAKPK